MMEIKHSYLFRCKRLLAPYLSLYIVVLGFVGLILALIACTPNPIGDQEQVAEGIVEFGKLKKDKDFTYGPTIREPVKVWNCENPEPRKDTLKEVKSVERDIQWSIEGEVGAGVAATIKAAEVSVKGAIASGYELNVSDELARSRELDLPVGANSSVEYIIEWQPALWSGYLPFSLQSADSRIKYQYQRLVFGEVVDINDRTLEDCGQEATPHSPPANDAATLHPEDNVDTPPAQATESPLAQSKKDISGFEVMSTKMKNNTGVIVDPGDIVTIQLVGGEWTGDSGKAGMANGCGFTYHDPDSNHVWLFPPEQRGAALVGYINDEQFYIGCRPLNVVASKRGELSLGMSDCIGCFWDNTGELYVDISVIEP